MCAYKKFTCFLLDRQLFTICQTAAQEIPLILQILAFVLKDLDFGFQKCIFFLKFY